MTEIIRQVTGKGFWDYVKDNIFIPLGVKVVRGNHATTTRCIEEKEGFTYFPNNEENDSFTIDAPNMVRLMDGFLSMSTKLLSKKQWKKLEKPIFAEVNYIFDQIGGIRKLRFASVGNNSAMAYSVAGNTLKFFKHYQ